MKKLYYSLGAVIFALAGLVACSSETLVDESPLSQAKGNSITVHIAGLAPATRATPAPDASNPKVTQTPALDREKAIADGRLYAVVFGSDGGFRKLVQAVKLAEGSYNFDMGQAGTFDLRLVANPDDALVAKLGTIASDTQLDALVASQSPGDNNQATHFLMTSAKTQVTTVAGQSTDAGTIRLERVAARIDLFNRIELLKMTRITFKNRYAESRLSRGAANLAMTGLAAPATKVYAAAEGLTDYECIGAIYGYENMEVGNTVLTLEATYNGKPIGTHDIVVGGVPVKRNHLYSIVISAKGGSIDPGDVFGSLKFDVVVNDWQEGATIEWKGDQLIDKSIPDFTVSGTNVTTLPAAVGNIPAMNPTKALVAQHTPSEVTVRIVSKSSGSKLSYEGGTLPTGYSIVPGAVGDENGQLTQLFTIRLGENAGASKLFKFVIENAFDSSVSRSFALAQRGATASVRPKMPLEYLAERSMGASGFVSSQQNFGEIQYFSWEDAVARFSHISIDGKGYHLATMEEWKGIVTGANLGWRADSPRLESANNVSEQITINGVTKIYFSDYRAESHLCYGLRYQDATNEMLCAVRYQYVVGSDMNYLVITSRYLGIEFLGDIGTISQESFWTANAADDVVRSLPALGNYWTNPSVAGSQRVLSYFKANGYFWTASPAPLFGNGKETKRAAAFSLYNTPGESLMVGYQEYEMPVHLIADE